MPGDAPDWATTPPSELATLTGSNLFLNGNGAVPVGGITQLLSHVVPAGKTFRVQGLSFGIQANAAMYSVLCELFDNGVVVTNHMETTGTSIIYQTPVPFAAGHTVSMSVLMFAPAGPLTGYVSLWGWEQ